MWACMHHRGFCRLSRHWMNVICLTWITQQCNNINWLKQSVEQRQKDRFKQKWQSEHRAMTSCDIYVEFKQEFKLEKCLLFEKQKVQTSYLLF